MVVELTDWQHAVVDEYRAAIAGQTGVVVPREQIVNLLFQVGIDGATDAVPEMNEYDAKALAKEEFSTVEDPEIDPAKRNIKPVVLEPIEEPKREVNADELIDL